MSSVTAVPIAPVKRGYLVWLWLGIALALVAAVALAAQGTRYTTTPSGLRYQVLKPGTGDARPTDTDLTLVNYTGRLTDGTVFDQSRQPTPMPVSGVVPGFSEGLKLMTKGSRYRFWLPPQLAYGATPPPGSPIPPNATLVFEVELVDFIPEAVVRQMQMQRMMGGGAPGGMPPGAPGGLPPQGVPEGR
jgi:FKBP-type peptidyl-prolyl cis-trans isomerase FkpA